MNRQDGGLRLLPSLFELRPTSRLQPALRPTELVLSERSIGQTAQRSRAGQRRARTAPEQASGPDRQRQIVREGLAAQNVWCLRNTRSDNRTSPAVSRSEAHPRPTP